MALDMNHSVRESNPFSSHFTVHTLSTFVLMTATTFPIYVTKIQRLTAGDVGRKLNQVCDI